jgi:hypothetical protein
MELCLGLFLHVGAGGGQPGLCRQQLGLQLLHVLHR